MALRYRIASCLVHTVIAMILANRREFFTSVAAGALAASTARSAGHIPIQAIAFDAFPILDPTPVFTLARGLFPEKGQDLVSVWRSRQFEYTWLRSLSKRYVNFWQVTEDALEFAARSVNLDLPASTRDQLMGAYLKMTCWPDVPPVLRALKKRGMRLAFLSNMTEQMLRAGIANANLSGLFDHVLSTDRVQAFKPDPRAYQMGIEAFGVGREQILFAAFAGWDVAGAKAFGYPTYWVNRQHQAAEELGLSADAAGPDLPAMADYLATLAGKSE